MSAPAPDGGVLDALFPALGGEAFRRSRWPRRAHVEAGPVERFGALLEAPGLTTPAALLAQPCNKVRILYRDRDGRSAEFELPPDQALRVYDLLGGTICVSDLRLPDGHAWLRRLDRELGVARPYTVFNAYATPAGGGVHAHYDHTEKIVVQVRGRKRWRIAPAAEEGPLRDFVPAAPAAADAGARMPDDVEVIDMVPGTAFFMPRATWHETLALEDSLSLTVSFARQTWADLLSDVLVQRLARLPAWRETAAGVAADGDAGRAARARFDALLARLGEDLGPLSAEHLLAPRVDPWARVTRRRRSQR